MKNVPAIFTREIRSYFSSPIAYAVLFVFVALSGFFFSAYIRWASLYQGEASMRATIHNINIIVLLVVPLMTMRLFAEEKRSGTIEMLMTSPVTDAEVVIGKFAASLVLFVMMLILTFPCPIFLMMYSTTTLDIAPMLIGYFGLFLLGAASLSLGVVASAITKNQMVAGLISFVMLLGLWLIDWMPGNVGGILRKFLFAISLKEHFHDLSKGILDTNDVIYYISFATFFLFLAVKLVQSAKWK